MRPAAVAYQLDLGQDALVARVNAPAPLRSRRGRTGSEAMLAVGINERNRAAKRGLTAVFSACE
jgi:hypothetical protein